MLISTQANRYAHQLIDSLLHTQMISPLSDDKSLTLDDSYEIAKRIMDIRTAHGEVQVGRKIGFTNQALRNRYGVPGSIDEPFWAPIFDTTVRYVENNRGVQSLEGALQPRIEAEIVFKLDKTPAPDASLEELASCIEWMAHAFEIVVCPFPDWKFGTEDAVAAFGLHGSLLIGEPHVLAQPTRRHLAHMLASASTSISCDGQLVAAGFGSDFADSPVHALWHLNRVLSKQPQFAPLSAGEIITTGTWTDSRPIKPGQTWVSAFSGISLPGLAVSFV
jgi:2-keto-4-pentenoate hydratase